LTAAICSSVTRVMQHRNRGGACFSCGRAGHKQVRRVAFDARTVTCDAWHLQADCPSRGGAAPPPPNRPLRDHPPHPPSSHLPERAAGGMGGEDVAAAAAPARRPPGLRGREIGLWSVIQLCSSRDASMTSHA
jgi:hypothetical protein